MSKYRILTIDGGGVRGLVTAILLKRIAAEPGFDDFFDQIDFVAGTSTGGLLALAIADNLDIGTIQEIYEIRSAIIFSDNWLDDLVDLGKLVGADYEIGPLRRELRRLFGATTLGELRKQVLIATFDLDNENNDLKKRTWKPKLFHNFEGDESDAASSAVSVGLYTAAAPTYFPSVDGYIDGGVFACNPSMCALAQTQDSRNRSCPSIDEIVLLSLGTGTSLNYIKGKSVDWGYLQWAKPLLSLIMDGTSGVADYQCRQILGSNYHRMAPVFPPGTSIPLDGINKIDYMKTFAASYPIDQTIDWIRAHWY